MAVFLAALLPVFLLLCYIWRKDPQPEPVSWLARAVLYGALMFLPILLVEMFVASVLSAIVPANTLLGSVTTAFFVAAVPEESFKLLALWLVLRKNPFFDEHFDGIVYAVCVGLGFAAFENIGYVLGEEENWAAVAIARSLLAVPGHYAFAVLMGYYYSVYHFVDHSPKVGACVLLVPVVAHGIYDALAMSGMVNEYVGSISFCVLVYFCVKMHKVAYKKIQAQIKRDHDVVNMA